MLANHYGMHDGPRPARWLLATLLAVSVVAGDRATAAATAAEDEVARRIEQWRGDWQRLDLERYMDHYGRDFKGDGLDRAAWRRRKQAVFRRAGSVTVSITGLEVRVERDRAQARFLQTYRSAQQQDVGRKTLLLAREDDGAWRIVSEAWQPAWDFAEPAAAPVAEVAPVTRAPIATPIAREPAPAPLPVAPVAAEATPPPAAASAESRRAAVIEPERAAPPEVSIPEEQHLPDTEPVPGPGGSKPGSRYLLSYNYLHSAIRGSEGVPLGLGLRFEQPLGHTLDLLLDTSAHRKNGSTTMYLTGGLGIRLTSGNGMRPFVAALAGVTRASGGGSTPFVAGAGAGVDLPLGTSIRWRLAEMDYLRTFLSGGSTGFFRFSSGISFGGGAGSR